MLNVLYNNIWMLSQGLRKSLSHSKLKNASVIISQKLKISTIHQPYRLGLVKKWKSVVEFLN